MHIKDIFAAPNIEYSDLSYHAYKKIKALILANKLNPNAKILQGKIAEELGISRMLLLNLKKVRNKDKQ